MNEFQQNVINILTEQAPVWIVGGAVRDTLSGLDIRDIDLVCPLSTEEIEKILREKGYLVQKIGKRYQTLSLFENDSRIDIVHYDDLAEDALHRDFTINAIYQNPITKEIYDPFEGIRDLIDRRLRACGEAEDRFREDPVRILRMVKFAVQFNMEIDQKVWKEAQKLLPTLESVSKERVTAELAAILVMSEAEKAVRMLEELGYWKVFIPELARLKGVVQNQYHSLDVWEHTLAVFRNTPQNLFLRLAGLFHDTGKWEVASRECYLAGSLKQVDSTFWLDKFKVIGTRGDKELEYKLKPFLGKPIKILAARLDQNPDTVQLKKIISEESVVQGLTYVVNGKRHFLNHEKASSKVLAEVLRRYSFSMFFDGGGQKRELDLLKLVENHMRATLVFMPEFRGEHTKRFYHGYERSFMGRVAELSWDICWNGRCFELQKIYDFIALWKADFQAGKIHNQAQKRMFEKIFGELIATAIWQQENNNKIDWELCRRVASEQGLTGKEYGKFKDTVRTNTMKAKHNEIDYSYLQKLFVEFKERKGNKI